MEAINMDTNLDVILSTADLGSSFSQSSCMGITPEVEEIKVLKSQKILAQKFK